MAYLAVLAFPDQISKRDEFVEACKAYFIKWSIRRGRYNRSDFEAEYRSAANRDLHNKIDVAQKRIFWVRLAALQIADRLSAELMAGQKASVHAIWRQSEDSYSIPFGRFRLVLDDALINPASDAGDDSIKVREKGVWRPSVPVIHLMVALRSAMLKMELWGDGNIVDLIIRADEWLIDALDAAECFRAFALNMWKIKPEDMISVTGKTVQI